MDFPLVGNWGNRELGEWFEVLDEWLLYEHNLETVYKVKIKAVKVFNLGGLRRTKNSQEDFGEILT